MHWDTRLATMLLGTCSSFLHSLSFALSTFPSFVFRVPIQMSQIKRTAGDQVGQGATKLLKSCAGEERALQDTTDVGDDSWATDGVKSDNAMMVVDDGKDRSRM